MNLPFRKSLLIEISGAVVVFISNIATARLLGISEFGAFSVTLGILNLALLLSRLGYDQLPAKYVSIYFDKDDFGNLKGFILFGILSIITSSILCVLFLFGILEFIPTENDTLILISITLPILALSQMLDSSLRGIHKILLARFIISIIRPSAYIIILITFLYYYTYSPDVNTAYLAYLYSILIMFLLLFLVFMLYIPKKIFYVRSIYNIKEWLSTSFSFMLISGFHMVLIQTNIIFIGALSNNEEAGLYSAASKFSGLISLIMISITQVSAPHIARLHKSKKHKELQQLIFKTNRVINFFCVPGILFIIIFGKPLLSLMGKDFADGYVILIILLFGHLGQALLSPANVILNMCGMQSITVKAAWVSVLFNIGLCIILIPLIQAKGAAIGLSVSLISWYGIMTYFTHKKLHLNIFDQSMVLFFSKIYNKVFSR